MEFYKNLDLEDLPNEIWVDAFGFDGLFQVSNLGRIKALERESLTRWGSYRILNERIVKQSVCVFKNDRIDNLNAHLIDKTVSCGRLFYLSFYPTVDFTNLECVMHINKNPLDNRIENLKKVSKSKSKNTDLKISKRAIKATKENLEKAIDRNIIYFSERQSKTCSKCCIESPLNKFTINKSVCKDCVNKKNRERRKNFVLRRGVKTCTVCKTIKQNNEFPKYQNKCKTCVNKYQNNFYHNNK